MPSSRQAAPKGSIERMMLKRPPGSMDELEEAILRLGSCIGKALRGRFHSLLIVGGAARGESTFGPDNRLLSDLDFSIVLPQRWVFSAWLAAGKCRGLLRRTLPWLEAVEWISIGYAYSSPRFWKMATPFMLEWRSNARVLAGSKDVRTWPALERSSHIPQWEGFRLIGNRVCEMIGGLGASGGGSFSDLRDEDAPRCTYKLVKLILACSEASLISKGQYGVSYRDRMQRQQDLSGPFSPADSQLIQEAYRAKLNDNPSFFKRPVAALAGEAFTLVFTTLEELKLAAPEEWIRYARMEKPAAPGWATDVIFFLSRAVHGEAVPFRWAIAGVYRDAHILAWDWLRRYQRNPKADFSRDDCRRIGERFRATPQFVSVVRGGRRSR